MGRSARSRSPSREPRSKPRSSSRRSRSRSPLREPPPAAEEARGDRRSSRDRSARAGSRERRQRSSSRGRGQARRRSSSRDRKSDREGKSGSRRRSSRSRSKEARRDRRNAGGSREELRHKDNRRRSRSRDRDRERDRERRSSRRSRSRSRDRRSSDSRRRRRDEDERQGGAPHTQGGRHTPPLLDLPPPPAEGPFPGPPPPGSLDPHQYPAAKRSRWDADRQQQQQQQQQQLGRGEPPGGGQHGSRWDAGRPGGDRRGPGGPPPLSDEPPAVGSIHRGVVQTVKPFGVFVAIEGYRRHVLIHHTQVSDLVVLTRSDEDELKVKALEYAVTPGQRVWAKVLEVSPDQGGSGFRIHGSLKLVDQESGADLDPTGQLAAKAGPGGGGGGGRLSDEPPAVGSIHRGEVKRIEAYGVFVALPGFRKYGLVHASQVANYLEFSAEDGEAERKAALGEVVDLGQEVWVKVVEVGEDEKGRGPKIGCSMKLVDQSDGADLDPQNMRYRPRGEGHGQGPGGSKAPIGAHAGEVKGGTIDWGHMSTRLDQFGSKGYDLLADEPSRPVEGTVGMQQQGGPGHHHHHQPHHHHHHHHHQQQQQRQAPMGRGRGAVVPAWMTQGVGAAAAGGGSGGGPAAPGSMGPGAGAAGAAADDARARMDLDEALRIVKEAAAGRSHKKEKKHKKDSSSKKHKKSSRKHSRRHRSRSRGRSSSSSSSGGSNGPDRGR